MGKYLQTAFLIFSLLLFAGCGFKKEVSLSGKTMGTTYHIKVVTGFFKNTKGLKDKVEMRLEQINKSMSTYRKDSEINLFNAFDRIGERFYISDDFFYVMKVAKDIYKLTGGAWDGTIKPIVNLWGFGNTKNKKRIPEKSEIEALLPEIGFNYIEISSNRYLVKRKASISLDLASIAKGYAVDQIAALIRTNGIKNFLVEIGGEVFAAGLRNDGKKWRVGINSPKKDAPFDKIYKVISLYNKGFATSGDYRIFFEFKGKRFSHIIDPRNGHPIDNGVVSVSIVADTCTFADGLATGNSMGQCCRKERRCDEVFWRKRSSLFRTAFEAKAPIRTNKIWQAITNQGAMFSPRKSQAKPSCRPTVGSNCPPRPINRSKWKLNSKATASGTRVYAKRFDFSCDVDLTESKTTLPTVLTKRKARDVVIKISTE
jgi:thiamine biosynthesis lipoprotein